VLETLNQARWYVARETLSRGRRGLKAMHELTGLPRPTILKGIRELQQGTRLKSGERMRAAGGGRNRVEDADPGFGRALERIMATSVKGIAKFADYSCSVAKRRATWCGACAGPALGWRACSAAH
jgi:hypothetical protein